MKLIKVIFLCLLICKTSFGAGLSCVLSGDCCGTDTEIVECELEDQEGESEEEKGCCDGEECECLCCAHVFMDSNKPIIEITFPTVVSESIFKSYTTYHHQFLDKIWQPPRLKYS